MKAKAIIFWSLMILASAGLIWRTATDLRESVWIAAFVAPFVVLASWFVGRFSGRKRRVAAIGVESIAFAVAAGSVAIWKLLLVRSGYGGERAFVTAFLVFVGCVGVSAWSFWRLRKLSA